MGLDLYIRRNGNSKTNARGHRYWTVTELCHMRNVWPLAEELNLENCVIVGKTGAELWAAVNNMNEDDPMKQDIKQELYDNKIKNDDYTCYDVEAWW